MSWTCEHLKWTERLLSLTPLNYLNYLNYQQFPYLRKLSYLFLLSRLPHRPTFLTEIGFLALEVVIAVFEELAPIACLYRNIH